MQIKNRQQLLFIVAGVVFGLLIGDKLIFTPLLNSWKTRAGRITDLRKQVDEGAKLLNRAEALRQRWSQMQTNALPNNKSKAEQQVLSAFDQWSRDARISAATLAIVLQRAWAGPVMPEFVASLPITGADGTLRRATASAGAGRAHLKTGSLRDVAAVAGYLLAPGGRRLVLVAIVNHPNAAAARPALDALIDWAMSARAQVALRP